MRGKHGYRYAILIAAVLSTAADLWAADGVARGALVVMPDERRVVQSVESMWARAAEIANGKYGEYITVNPGKAFRSDLYRANLTVSVDGENRFMVISMTADGRDGGMTIPIMRGPDELAAMHVADALLSLWYSFQGTAGPGGVPPPLLEEISVDGYVRAAKPALPALYPVQGIEPDGNGGALLALGSMCFHVDSRFALTGEIGRELAETYTPFASDVGMTPAGTVVFKPGLGRELYRYLPGALRPQKLRAGFELSSGPMGVLDDGSIVVLDSMNKTARRIDGRESFDVPLFTNPNSYIMAMAVGPENTLWVYDQMETGLRIHASDGTLIDTIRPLFSPGTSPAVYALDVYSNGDFVLYGNDGLRKFDRLGFPLWHLSGLEGYAEGPLPVSVMAGGLAVDEAGGRIWLSDHLSRRLLVFLEDPAPDVFERSLLEINRRLGGDPEDTGALEEKAALYTGEGSYVLARTAWERILEMDPSDGRAAEEADGIEVYLLGSLAAEQARRVSAVLDELGPESARSLYQQTVQLYERLLAIDPGNRTERDRLSRLRDEFSRKSALPTQTPKILRINSAEVEDLFPSLISHYRNRPVGTVRVENVSDTAVGNIRASLRLPGYIDAPLESPAVERLDPGEEAVLELRLILSETVLTLEEDLPLVARISVFYDTDGSAMEVSKTTTVTLHRNTALSWDRSEKLISFITPRDRNVENFSLKVLSAGGFERPGIPEKVTDAARISDALGVYGIRYVEDPRSPISGILGDGTVIDTVRFPRRTLQVRTGDCDDTTALLGALFESAGIGVAVMTSPGHVFLAFDSGEHRRNAWLLSTADLEVIEYGGTVWIPVETTVLGDGFRSAWVEASKLVRSHRDDVEFLPLSEYRAEFPPIPIPEDGTGPQAEGGPFFVVEPSPERIDELHRPSMDRLTGELYHDGVEELTVLAERASGKREIGYLNRIGILHARFGRFAEAEKIFVRNIRNSPDFIPSYVNLANLEILRGDDATALKVLETGLSVKPDSVQLSHLAAGVLSRMGNREKATEFYRVVESMDPELARSIPFPGAADTADRAGLSAPESRLIWDGGE